MYGKSASDIQDGIVFDGNAIRGTLKYVDDYTGFSGDEELQKGNYIALNFSAEGSDSITAKILGGSENTVTLDETGDIVIRVTSTTQAIEITVTDGDDAQVYRYNFNGLILEAA